MPIMDSDDARSQGEVLSAAVRLIRRHRSLRSADVADRMNLALRSYEHFEAGAGRVNLERIHRFARATSSDPYSILAALALGSPQFALRTADNKLMTIWMIVLQEFDAQLAESISTLETREIVTAFSELSGNLRTRPGRGISLHGIG